LTLQTTVREKEEDVISNTNKVGVIEREERQQDDRDYGIGKLGGGKYKEHGSSNFVNVSSKILPKFAEKFDFVQQLALDSNVFGKRYLL
jgi:hypothetical protein